MKTTFELETQFFEDRGAAATIIGKASKGDKVYLAFSGADEFNVGYIKDADLEKFAVNILKALGSKKLEPVQIVRAKSKKLKR